jgi:hypothetical protein
MPTCTQSCLALPGDVGAARSRVCRPSRVRSHWPASCLQPASTQAGEALYLSRARHAPSVSGPAPRPCSAAPRRRLSNSVPCPTASSPGSAHGVSSRIRTRRHTCRRWPHGWLRPRRVSPRCIPHLIRRVHVRLGRHQPLHHLLVPALGSRHDRGPFVLRGGKDEPRPATRAGPGRRPGALETEQGRWSRAAPRLGPPAATARVALGGSRAADPEL